MNWSLPRVNVQEKRAVAVRAVAVSKVVQIYMGPNNCSVFSVINKIHN